MQVHSSTVAVAVAVAVAMDWPPLAVRSQPLSLQCGLRGCVLLPLFLQGLASAVLQLLQPPWQLRLLHVWPRHEQCCIVIVWRLCLWLWWCRRRRWCGVGHMRLCWSQQMVLVIADGVGRSRWCICGTLKKKRKREGIKGKVLSVLSFVQHSLAER